MSKSGETTSAACPGMESACWEIARREAENWDPERILRWADKSFGEGVAVASAFGVEGIALIDMAAQVWPRPRVFVLDTGFLFPETYRLMEQVEARYGISIERILPALTPQAQAETCGPELWSRNPNRCCELRKVEPLRRKLASLRAWVASIRRDQTPERTGIHKIEWDANFQLVKINPLADWSMERVWNYVHARQLAYNPLYDRQYPSIGCTPCTRAVQPGEDCRAGRWSGFAKRECGLHVQDTQGESHRVRPGSIPTP